MNLFAIKEAFAAEAEAGAVQGKPSMFGDIAVIGLLICIVYFLVIRPQQRRQKEHVSMLDSLKHGDRIVLANGIVGTFLKKEDDKFYVVEIASNVSVIVRRDGIVELVKQEEKKLDKLEKLIDAKSKKIGKKTKAGAKKEEKE